MMILFILLLMTPCAVIFPDSLHSDKNIDISFIKQNYLGNEPIEILVSIANCETNDQTFLISDILFQSIVFDLRTSKNEKIPLKPIVEAQLNTIYKNPSLYRKITLKHGESFSRILDLRSFFEINEYQIFYIKGFFYPNPDDRSFYYESAFTSFNHIVPPVLREKMIQEYEERKKELSLISNLPPNELVANLFKSQLKKDWDQFLLHFDFEKLIYSFHNFSKQYDEATDMSFRLHLLEEFKRYLTVHWNINLLSYSIKKTVITEDSAYVTADVIEKVRSITRRLRYNMTLYQTRTGQWLISEYSVLILN